MFNRDSFTRWTVIIGSLISIFFSLGILFAGVGIWTITLYQHRVHGLLYFSCHAPHEVLSIALNVVVTICTECAGKMHSTSLRFALFQEHRATYSSNLRLLTGADKKLMNSAAINAIMTLLLILSYASSSFFYQEIWNYDYNTKECGVQAIPAIVLGISLFLQTCISLFALRDTQILTWSNSPCDTIPALLSMHGHRSLEKHYSLPDSRICTCAGCKSTGARTSLDRQPSAWDTCRGVRISVRLLWGLAFVCTIWGIWVKRFVPNLYPSWQFIPSELAQASVGDSVGGDATYFITWFSLYAVMAVTQGGLTFGLHCAELVVGVIRDERLWRRRAPNDATDSSFRSWLHAFFLDNWLNAVLLFAKTFLHWMFGLAVEIWVGVSQTDIDEVPGLQYYGGLSFYFAQIFYLAVGVYGTALVFTLAARHHPKGVQPVTYGHIKTLLHLMDGEALGDKDDSLFVMKG